MFLPIAGLTGMGTSFDLLDMISMFLHDAGLWEFLIYVQDDGK